MLEDERGKADNMSLCHFAPFPSLSQTGYGTFLSLFSVISKNYTLVKSFGTIEEN
jgi:hypothetical protein